MKVDKQLPAVSAIESHERRAPVMHDSPLAKQRKARPAQAETAARERPQGKGAGFNLQLNQQLSSMQSAESYLDELTSRLRQLKLSLSRELSSAQSSEREGIKQAMQQVEQLLSERPQRSANSLDANLKLRLTEPVRSHFSLEGLESIEAVQRAGKETLLFSAGRQSSEPLAVVLDEQMSAEQILRRFNSSLGQVGVRAEVQADGALKFSARESDWQELKGQIAVQGEDKLFAKGRYSPLQAHEDRLLSFPPETVVDNTREMRRVLDSVVAALDKVAAIRDQISHRQQEIREFLARQADQDEQQWARDYVGQVFSLMNRSPSSYAAVTQTVVAQANISRFSVVSLLS